MSFYESLAEWSKSLWPFLVNHLWQASIFCLFVLVVSSLLKRAPARLRYSLWLLALVKFMVPAAVIASLLSRAGIDFNSLFTANGAGAATGLGISPLLAPVSVSPVTFYAVEECTTKSLTPLHYVVAIQDHGSLYGALTLLWMTVCVLLFTFWLKNRKALSATIRAGAVVHCGREAATLERVRSWLGLRRKVSLVISSEMTEPGVWGILRPVVVLPEGVSEHLTDDELEAVMMHEMIHVERWDNLVAVLQRIIRCLLWFNPLLWLLDKQLLAEREQSCDDTVIKLGGASKVYASSITKVCRHSIGWAQPGLSSAAGSNLKRRINRIMSAEVKRTLSAPHFALLCVVAATLFVLSSLAGGGIKGLEEVTRGVSYGGVDPRFVETDSKDSQQNLSAAKANPAKLSTLSQSQDTSKQPSHAPGEPVQVFGGTEQIAPPDVRTVAEINRRNIENQQNNSLPPAQTPPISAAIISASETQTDLSRFVGRYEVDPAKVENFVLDITLEGGELWLKPSHAHKRQLLLIGDTRLLDVKSDFSLSALQDRAGRVTGLRLDSWRSDITARKLLLPQPSLQGNTTFRLSGHADARIVAVAGSFNNWNQSQFLFSRVNGEWICKVNLPPGKYEYKFIVDGNWLVDPRNPQTTYDDRGNENSVLVSE
jgi:beta-lactamase regulating signal transducer with metallopeptidase domain